MKRSDFHFDLPPDLIAQHPAPDRDGARLLVVDARTGSWSHRAIRDLPELIPAGSLCVPNDVRVRHARLFLRRRGGGSGEALLLRSLGSGVFEALVRPGARLKPGASATVIDPVSLAELARIDVLGTLPEGLRTVRVHAEHGLDWDEIDRIGRLPLPPYIEHLADAEDETRYQTVFAAREGEAVAAPTAGLHFTPELIAALQARGCGWHPVRLHVGLGTFRPMTAERLEDHAMHEERFEIPIETAAILEPVFLNRSRPVLCVGTTSLRTLEGAWAGTSLARRAPPGCSSRRATGFALRTISSPTSTCRRAMRSASPDELAISAKRTVTIFSARPGKLPVFK